MKSKHFFILSILFSVLITSCEKDDETPLDTEKPQLHIDEPVNDATFQPGGELHLDGELTDNQGLASYKIDVHNNFDGHTHGRVLSLSSQTDETDPWTFNRSFPIEGAPKSFDLHKHIEIPENIAEGAYHLGIVVIDDAGNQNQAFIEIVIGHDHGHEHE